MASRRSARLSALAADTKTPTPPPPPKTTTSRKRKTAADPTPAPPSPDDSPSTPQRRKTTNRPLAPPETPTPAAVNLMTAAGNTLLPKPAPITRLASPTKTNAPLFSPQTTRLIAPAPLPSPSPSKPPQPSTKTTSATLLTEACAHLIRVDPRMAPLIAAHPCPLFSPEGLATPVDPFEALASGIISQQVSGAAAKAIKARFVALFPLEEAGRRFPAPAQVAGATVETLRGAGLSGRKAEYVKGLAEKFVSGELDAGWLAGAEYEEVVERLVAVRGLGRWSVEMFACFGLKRMDVFSLGDLGVQRGMAAFVGRDVKKLKNGKGGEWKYMSEKEMEEISDRFRPYRSLFMWYMWRVEDTDVSTME